MTAQLQPDTRNRIAARLRSRLGVTPEWEPTEQEIQDELDEEAGREAGRHWAQRVAEPSDLRRLDEASFTWGDSRMSKFSTMREEAIMVILRRDLPKVAADRAGKRNLAFAEGFFRAAMEHRNDQRSRLW